MPINNLARAMRNRTCIWLTIAFWGSLVWSQAAPGQNADPGQASILTEPSAAQDAAKTNPASPIRAELPDAPSPEFVRLPEFAPSPEFAPAAELTSAGRADVSEAYSVPPPLGFSPGAPEAWGYGVLPNSERVPLNQCPYDTTHARECRIHWHALIIEASVFNAFQNAGNLYTGYWYRWETLHGKWFQRWFNSDLGWNWNHWVDGNPATDQYLGHPFMGAITDSMWIQNDPKGATLQIGDPGYWKSRMRALTFTTLYHFEWKFGPFGEAGVGHIGDHPTHSVAGEPRNDTGIVELVTTPVGGMIWTVLEDELDKHVVKAFEEKPRSPFALLLISFLTPGRATANIFRWRPPWYRDGRDARSNTFWSQPPAADEAAAESGDPSGTGTGGAAGNGSGVVEAVRHPEVLPVWPHPGGVHEFGAWWGLSLMSGHIWGYAKDVKYMPIDVSYSYLLFPKLNLRYAPELTALAMLDEPTPGGTDRFTQRKRTYGSGISPVGFRESFFSESRVQPFLSTDGGVIYFTDRVLSPQGSQFMYTIDFGGGLQFHRNNREAFTIGYRYQHLSNANISLHNPGTDTNVFYLAVSRFRTKGYR